MLADFRELEELIARFTNYERLPSFRYDRHTLGLDRMRELARALGNPDRDFPSVHIAGTKGKGSTSLILEALLLAAGHRVGTYTSPHVEHLRERIRIDGAVATESAVLREANRLFPLLDELRGVEGGAFPTFFELMTALAMACCSTARVDWGVFEVGLGGRLDATNILAPRLTAITSIGLEHTQLLGNTLAKIAREKAGIIKPATPIVLGPLPPEARTEILQIAAERSAPVIDWNERLVEPADPGRLRVAGHGAFAEGSVIGPALRTDLAIALTLAELVLEFEGRKLDGRIIAGALERVELPARIERFEGPPPVVMDSAHTADSIRALRSTLDEVRFPRPRTLIFSVANGKDLPGILEELPRIAEDVIFTLADPVRSVPPEKLLEMHGRGTVIESPRDAFEEALRAGKPIVATGSFYLAGALRPLVRKLTFSSAGPCPDRR